jgi:hypothetical protein
MTAVLGGATFGLLVWWLVRHQFLAGVAVRMGPVHQFHATDVTPLLRRYMGQLGLDAALLLAGLSMAVVLLLIATRRPDLRRSISGVALVGVVLTLFLFGSGYHTVIPTRLVAEKPFTVSAMDATAPAGPWRVLQWDTLRVHADVAVHRGWWPADEQGYRRYIAGLPGNYNLMWGLSSVRQEEWSALPLPHTRLLASAILANGDQYGFRAVAPYLPWWNVGYVVSRRPLDHPSLTLLAADQIHVYRTRDHGRRAWIVHSATVEPDGGKLLARLSSEPEGLMEQVVLQLARGGEREQLVAQPLGKPSDGESEERAWIQHRSPTRVTVAAVAAREGYLVLGESWAPGWRAWLDGRAVPIHRANIIHRAVRLPAGRHRVEFRYLPTSFRLGLFLSLGATAVLLALVTARWGFQR